MKKPKYHKLTHPPIQPNPRLTPSSHHPRVTSTSNRIPFCPIDPNIMTQPTHQS